MCGEQDILRLDVPVRDGVVVKIRHRTHELLEETVCFGRLQSPGRGYMGVEVTARAVFYDKTWLSLLVVEAVDRAEEIRVGRGGGEGLFEKLSVYYRWVGGPPKDLYDMEGLVSGGRIGEPLRIQSYRTMITIVEDVGAGSVFVCKRGRRVRGQQGRLFEAGRFLSGRPATGENVR